MAREKTSSRRLLADEEMATIRETEQLLRLSHSTIYRLINEGQLDTRTIGRKRLVTMASIRELLGAGTAA